MSNTPGYVSNSELAQRLSTLVDRWDRRENQMIALVTQEEGTVIVTDGLNRNHELPSFPQLQKDVNRMTDALTGSVAEVRDMASAVTQLAAAASQSASEAEHYADAAEQTAQDIQATAASAKTEADRAAAEATKAASSASTASSKATAASNSAKAAADSATQASGSATAAAASASSASDSMTQARLAQTSAEGARDAAAAAQAGAHASASAAAASADAAAASATAAASSASTASSKATAASNSATTAATKASEAAASAASAAHEADVAASAADAASDSAGTAAAAATAASTSASQASAAAAAADASRAAAAGLLDDMTDLADLVEADAQAAASSKDAAAASAAAAASSAATAADRANAAAASAATAATKATEASGSATTAASHASSASGSAAAAASSSSSAASAKVAAEAARDKANLYANAPQGTEVSPGEYSAKHWALQAQAATTGALVYMGTWNPSAGSYPTAPVKGHFYKVVGNGKVGDTTYNAGDQIVYDGAAWDKIDNTDQVSSVAGKTGAVTLVAGDIGGLGALATRSDVDFNAHVTGKPSTYPPSNHTHTKSQVGLGNVDNTADLDKPISTATQAALDGKAPLVHTHAIADVSGLQSALDGKAKSSHTHSISNITNLQTTLDAKADLSGATFTGPVTVSVSGDGATLFTLNAERPWLFRQVGSGADTKLQLFDNTGGKTFQIAGTNTSNVIEFAPSSGTIKINGKAVWHAGTFDPTSKADASHTHEIADVNGLQTALDGKLGTTATAAAATKLATSRTLKIGDTGKSFNGTANVTWTLADIGAAAASHSHTVADVTGLQAALDSLAPLDSPSFTGTVALPGANSLRIGGADNSQQGYLSFYTAGNNTTRTGYIGYGNDGATDLTVANERSGYVVAHAAGIRCRDDSGVGQELRPNGEHLRGDANNRANLRRQPRIFVQSADPGAAAAEGDLWIW